jgi:hypothetical protein
VCNAGEARSSCKTSDSALHKANHEVRVWHVGTFLAPGALRRPTFIAQHARHAAPPSCSRAMLWTMQPQVDQHRSITAKQRRNPPPVCTWAFPLSRRQTLPESNPEKCVWVAETSRRLHGLPQKGVAPLKLTWCRPAGRRLPRGLHACVRVSLSLGAGLTVRALWLHPSGWPAGRNAVRRLLAYYCRWHVKLCPRPYQKLTGLARCLHRFWQVGADDRREDGYIGYTVHAWLQTWWKPLAKLRNAMCRLPQPAFVGAAMTPHE